jgi:plasmid stabilization system protein ParE
VSRTLEVHPGAQAEAEAAARYYAERSPRAAEAFVQELDNAVAEIELAPQRFPKHAHGTRRVLLRTFPFAIVYRFDEATPGEDALGLHAPELRVGALCCGARQLVTGFFC